MEQPADRVETEKWMDREVKIAQKGRVARVLEFYARSIEARDETCIDSGLPDILRRAAGLLREHCPETREYEKRMEFLGRIE